MKKSKPLLLVGSLLFSMLLSASDPDKFPIRLPALTSGSTIWASEVPEFSFHLPQMSGNLRFGVVNGKESRWPEELKEVKVNRKGGQLIYTIKDHLLGKGKLTVKVIALTDTDGIIMEVHAEQIPEEVRLFWAFGGCVMKVLEDKAEGTLKPEYCKYNVWNVEGNAFTVYYGEEMNFRTFNGITPPTSEIRVSDAHRLGTPLQLWGSGRDTDAPVLAASCPLVNGENLYFCFFRRNRTADHNYFLLPELFRQELTKSKKTEN